MKHSVVLGVLVATGLLALSATTAQAGSGGFVSPLTSFFVCHSINGDSPGVTVDVESPVFGPDRTNVKIGKGTLACAWARLFYPGTDHAIPTNEISPNPNFTHDVLKCHSISVKKNTSGNPGPPYTFTDELFPGGEEAGVQATEIRYICSPSTLSLPVP